MSVIEERLPYLEPLVLESGGHDSPNNGLVHACVMEAVAYVAGEPWSDHPECASPVLGAFLRSWNDSLSDEDRQMLKPLIPRLVGTKASKEVEEKRAWMATDWLARECAPAFLRLAGLTGHAESLEGLAALTTTKRAKKAQPTLAAAGAAAGDAAGDAAGAAAGAAYADYIERIRTSGSDLAVYVKLADLDTNLGRLDEERASLEGRYRRAIADLTFEAVDDDA